MKARLKANQLKAEKDGKVYPLSNRFFIKWTPSALIGASSSSLRVGAEYCFAKRLGIGVEGGPELLAPRYLDNSKETGGWNIYVEPRCYFSLRRYGRGYAGIHSFYRSIGYDSGRASAEVKYEDLVTFTQSSAQRKVLGFGFYGGYMAHLAGGLHVELSNGFGVKNVNVERHIIGSISKPAPTSSSYPTEPGVFQHATLLYFVLEIKISYLLGGYGRKNKL